MSLPTRVQFPFHQEMPPHSLNYCAFGRANSFCNLKSCKFLKSHVFVSLTLLQSIIIVLFSCRPLQTNCKKEKNQKCRCTQTGNHNCWVGKKEIIKLYTLFSADFICSTVDSHRAVFRWTLKFKSFEVMLQNNCTHKKTTSIWYLAAKGELTSSTLAVSILHWHQIFW